MDGRALSRHGTHRLRRRAGNLSWKSAAARRKSSGTRQPTIHGEARKMEGAHSFAGGEMKGLRERLQKGDVLLGQLLLEFFTPGIGPMLDACGLDFVIFDMEHGRCDIGLLEVMIASCRGSGIVPMARVPDLNFAPLSRVLDLGAQGVMVPRVETRQQTEEIVRQLKYAPQGRRGVALGIAHDLYRQAGAEFFAKANQDTIVIIQVETARAFENLDDILSVRGVDVA